MRFDCRGPRRQRGLSFAEVLIALGMSAIIALSLTMLFSRSVASRAQIDRDGQKIEAGRYSLDTMAEDIRLAGFYGDFMPRDVNGSPWPDTDANMIWQAPDPCATALGALGWYNGDDTSAALPSPLPSPTTRVYAPVAVFGYQAPSGLACLSNRRAGSDVLVVRRASTVAYSWGTPTAGQWNAIDGTTGAAAVANDYYIQASTCTYDSVRFVFNTLASATANTGFNALRNTSCSTARPAIRRYIQRIYYVADCNVCTGGGVDATPTLKVAELGPGGLTIRSITPGVENLHFEYGVDTDFNGSADSYAESVAAPNVSTPFGWQNVMSVKTWVLVRDTQPTNQFTNTNTYVLGGRTVASPSDSFRRAVFSSTVRLNNPAGAREAP